MGCNNFEPSSDGHARKEFAPCSETSHSSRVAAIPAAESTEIPIPLRRRDRRPTSLSPTSTFASASAGYDHGESILSPTPRVVYQENELRG